MFKQILHRRCYTYIILLFPFFVLFSSFGYGQDSLLTIRDAVYALYGETWYVYSNQKPTHEINPTRLILRRADRREITLDNLAIENKRRISIGRRLPSGSYVIIFKDTTEALNAASAFSQSPQYDRIFFDVYGDWGSTPNDPMWSDQWNLGSGKLNMSGAWDITRGDKDIIVAVMDSGCYTEHEDLEGNINLDLSWNFFDDNEDVHDLTPFGGHGTMVTGIIGARANNNEGIAGIAGGWGNKKGARLMILKVGNANPLLTVGSSAIEWAAEKGAHVVNMSFIYSPEAEEAIEIKDAINKALIDRNDNMVFMGATGNSNVDSIKYPARLYNVIAVGATDSEDLRWQDQEYENVGSNYGPEIDVVAPTVVPTTGVDYPLSDPQSIYVNDFDGTSAAAPHVSGLAALMFAVNPDLTWQEVRIYLEIRQIKYAKMSINTTRMVLMKRLVTDG